MSLPPRAVDTILRTAGRTPLVRLAALERPGGPRLFAKCEFLGPTRAITDRAAAHTLVAALHGEHLPPGRALVTAGGTDASISLAMAASAIGHRLTVVAPAGLHPQRKRFLTDYGAELHLVDDALGLDAAQDLAFELATATRALFVDLCSGHEVLAAYEALGIELVEALGGPPTLTVCGLDLGAIPTGLARGTGAPILAVEPAAARIASAGTFGPHFLLGLAPGPVPRALDRDRVRDFEPVTDREAWDAAEHLSHHTDLHVGLASGAVLAATLRRAPAFGPDATLVAVLPDAADRRLPWAGFFP